MRIIELILFVAALLGVGLGAYAWLDDGTGVTGTPGALLALVGAVAVALASIPIGLRAVRGGLRGVLLVLMAVGALLTAVAAWFLMQDGFALAMAVVFLCVIGVALARPARRVRAGVAR